MALLLVSLIASAFAAPAFAASTWYLGGATSFAQLGPKALTTAFSTGGVKAAAGVLTSYASVGSGAGQAAFIAGTYLLAVSDDPLTSALWVPLASKPLTLPLVISLYGFFIKTTNTGVKLDAASTLSIYTKITATSTWSTALAPGAILNGLTGAAAAVARSDSSGTTQLIKTFWSKAASASIILDPSSFSTSKVNGGSFSSAIVYASGGGAVITAAAASKASAIVYSQLGLAATNSALKEAAIKNAGGFYISTSGVLGVPAQVIPQTLVTKLRTDNWADVGPLTVFQTGAATPPIASFEYFFAQQSYKGNVAGASTKALITFLNTGLGALAPSYSFFAAPSAVTANNAAASYKGIAIIAV